MRNVIWLVVVSILSQVDVDLMIYEQPAAKVLHIMYTLSIALGIIAIYFTQAWFAHDHFNWHRVYLQR